MEPSGRALRVCWAGTFDPEFERNRRLRDYLEAAGLEYSVVRVRLWPIDRIDAFGHRRLAVILRMLVAYPRLLIRLLKAPTPDLYLVSYPGWFDVPVVKTVAWLKRRPIVFDIFISLFDTAIADRKLANPTSAVARVSRVVDRVSMRLSERVIADCPAHARFLSKLAGLPSERFGVVYVGADEKVFHPVEVDEPPPRIVLFYGTYVPLQGVEWIVRAAARLADREYRFRIVGAGQDAEWTRELAYNLGIQNVEFVGPMPKHQLASEMARASLCLGIFGTSAKADRVIPHKVFEAIACGRPVLTGATAAIKETFEDDEVATCNVGDTDSLAEHLIRLLEDHEDRAIIASQGRARFLKDFSLEPQAARLRSEFEAAARHG